MLKEAINCVRVATSLMYGVGLNIIEAGRRSEKDIAIWTPVETSDEWLVLHIVEEQSVWSGTVGTNRSRCWLLLIYLISFLLWCNNSCFICVNHNCISLLVSGSFSLLLNNFIGLLLICLELLLLFLSFNGDRYLCFTCPQGLIV